MSTIENDIKILEQKITELKKQCDDNDDLINNENESKNSLSNANKMDSLMEKISLLKIKNSEYTKKLSEKNKIYEDLVSMNLKNNGNTIEQIIENKQNELNELEKSNNSLENQVNTMKSQCSLLKDENYITNMISYWYPQAMFKYCQTYDKMNTDK